MTRIALCVTLALFANSARADWPGWRGPAGDGTIPAPAVGDYPLTWSATENVRWKVPVPAGNACPVIAGDAVFVAASSGREGQTLELLAYHLDTGKRLWRTALFATPGVTPFTMFPPERGLAAPTPVWDGERLIALFGSGDLATVDRDGRPLWFRSLAKDYGPISNDYGIAASPVVAGGLAIVQVDHALGSYLLAVDAKTGETRWKVPREAFDNWASPVVTSVAGETQVVCLGTRTVVGYDLATGTRRWKLDGPERLCATSPIARGGVLYAVSGPGGASLAFDLSTSPPRRLWSGKNNGPFIPSPVVAGDKFVMPDDQGFVTCLDAASGREVWRERAGTGRGRPSPVAVGDRVYLTGLDGTTVVFRAADTFEPLAKNTLGEDAAASPALSGGWIVFRTAGHLVCIGK